MYFVPVSVQSCRDSSICEAGRFKDVSSYRTYEFKPDCFVTVF